MSKVELCRLRSGADAMLFLQLRRAQSIFKKEKKTKTKIVIDKNKIHRKMKKNLCNPQNIHPGIQPMGGRKGFEFFNP